MAGSTELGTEVWVYEINGVHYEVHVIDETIERIDVPEMSKEAPPPDPCDGPDSR